MSEKKELKVRFSTVVLVFLVIILAIALIAVIHHYNTANEKSNSNNASFLNNESTNTNITTTQEKINAKDYEGKWIQDNAEITIEAIDNSTISFVYTVVSAKPAERIATITINNIKLDENGSGKFEFEGDGFGTKGNGNGTISLSSEKVTINIRKVNMGEDNLTGWTIGEGERVFTSKNNNVQTNNDNKNEFSNEEIKNAIQNYLDLRGAIAGSPEGLLEKLGLLTFGQYNETDTNNYRKTNIKYEEYKNIMLNYMTEEWFQKTKFTEYFKNENGLLYFRDVGASGMRFEVESVDLKGDYSKDSYIANIYNVGLSGIKELENVEFHISDNNGKCVISYCDY